MHRKKQKLNSGAKKTGSSSHLSDSHEEGELSDPLIEHQGAEESKLFKKAFGTGTVKEFPGGISGNF